MERNNLFLASPLQGSNFLLDLFLGLAALGYLATLLCS